MTDTHIDIGTPPEAVANIGGTSVDTSSATRIDTGNSLTLRRNEFVRSIGTGDTLDAKGNRVATAREVTFSPEMLHDYSDFLGNHLTNIRSAVDRKTLKLSALPKKERDLVAALTNP